VFVGDVANAIAKAVGSQIRPGITYELGGRNVRTFKELMEFVLSTIVRQRLLVPTTAKLQASVLQFLPEPPLTPDQVEPLKRDNVVSSEAEQRAERLLRSRYRACFDRSGRPDLSPQPVAALNVEPTDRLKRSPEIPLGDLR
jgi:uncharacterized protein YbjT (DUF2867 family)